MFRIFIPPTLRVYAFGILKFDWRQLFIVLGVLIYSTPRKECSYKPTSTSLVSS